MVELKRKDMGFANYAGAYLASEVSMWFIFGVVLSVGLFVEDIAFVIGLGVAALVFWFLVLPQAIFRCMECMARYRGCIPSNGKGK